MAKKTHIVALSGGKDSSALALRLLELNPDQEYLYICTPTGDELPEMAQHWERLECLLGQKIIRVHNNAEGFETLENAIRSKSCLPNWRMRWCTEILKIHPAQEFYSKHLPCVVYVGLRADEKDRHGGIFGEGVEQKFPFKEWGWGLSEVMGYLQKNGVSIPERTDCGMCFYQRIGEWWNLWKYHPHRWGLYEGYEAMLGKTLLCPGKFSNWPHALRDLRREFEKGRIPKGANDHFAMFSGHVENGKCRACTL